MKKKEIKKTKLKPRKKVEIIKGQIGMLMEHVDHKFDIISEGFSDLSKKVDDNYRDLNKKIDDNHIETNENFKTLFKFRDKTGDNFKANFEYLSKIDDELQLIKLEIADLKTGLKDKADVGRLVQVEERMSMIEKQMEAMVF